MKRTMTSKWVAGAVAVAAGAALVVSGAAAGAGAAGARSGPGVVPGSSGPTKEPVGGRFYAVAATSSGNAWAVGLQSANSLIMHWSGSRSKPYRWRISPTNPVGYFLGVAALSASDAWAVGGTNWFYPSRPLAEHWNGRTWTRFAAPTPGPSGYFKSVAAISPSDVWAVGMTGGGPGDTDATRPLIDHWNGTRWTKVRFPEPAAGGQFNGVAASSADNVWVVGRTDAATQATVIEHWNGVRWSRVRSPSPAGAGDSLAAVTVTGADNAWAAGARDTGSVVHSLIERWNGSRWAVQSAPSPSGDVDLNAITASSSRNAWAVGYTNPTSCSNGGPPCETAVLHWNGNAWATTPSVNPPGTSLDVLEGVAIINGHDAWTVGTDNYWSSTLIERWNGTAWKWRLPR